MTPAPAALAAMPALTEARGAIARVRAAGAALAHAVAQESELQRRRPLEKAAAIRRLMDDPAGNPLTGKAHTTSQPDRRVKMWELDRALVRASGLLGPAQHVLAEARAAGLAPPPRFGTEVVARLLGLRYNHPSQNDGLELLPGDPATRAEAAYSFARLLELSSWTAASAESRADGFDLPELTDWQRRILARAVKAGRVESERYEPTHVRDAAPAQVGLGDRAVDRLRRGEQPACGL